MSKELKEPSTEDGEIIAREIAVHTPLRVVSTDEVNSSHVGPVYVSRSTSTRTADFDRDRGINLGASTERYDLESRCEYGAWVEGGSWSSKSRNDDPRSQLGENRHVLRTRSLYSW